MSNFLQTLAGQKTDSIPFWFMRQAGRYLPEYRALREKAGGFLAMAYNPDMAAEITIQPIRRFQMSAAIIFSDILVIPHALGQHLEFVAGEGPKLDPLTTPEEFKKLNYKNLKIQRRRKNDKPILISIFQALTNNNLKSYTAILINFLIITSLATI